MRKRIKQKLHGNLGETISETLVALLISSLALVMLAAAITSSSAMISKSRAKLKDYYDKEETLVSRTDPITENSPTMTITDVTVNPSDGRRVQNQAVTVTYYKNDEFRNTPVIAYKKSG